MKLSARRRRQPRRQQVLSVQIGMPPDAQARRYSKHLFPERDEITRTGPLMPPVDGWRTELTWKTAIYRDRVVDWALMLNVIEDVLFDPYAGDLRPRRKVERIDCCESQIHRHLFTTSSDPRDNQGVRVPLRTLTYDDAAIVDQEYDHYLNLLMADYPERVRRWLNG